MSNIKDIISLKKEASELTAIFTAIGNTAKVNYQKSKFEAKNKSKLK